jgi:hypothetical protein
LQTVAKVFASWYATMASQTAMGLRLQVVKFSWGASKIVVHVATIVLRFKMASQLVVPTVADQPVLLLFQVATLNLAYAFSISVMIPAT